MLQVHQSRALRQYKKVLKKEKSTHKLNDGPLKTSKFHRKTKATNSIMKAYHKSLLVQEEKKRQHKERREEDGKKDLKRKERYEVHKKMNARTSKGQPVMKNRIDVLLNKIEKKKDLYCLK